jgi:O-antigen ligase
MERRLRWPLAAIALATLAGAAATLSRGAAIGVAVGLAVVVALSGRRRAWYWYGAGLAGAAVAFALLAEGRLLATGGAGGESTRFMIWRSSLRMARDHPLFGVGLDQFLYQYQLRYVEPAGWPERYTSHPHNLLLDLWLRLGILGVVVFAWLIAATARLFQAARRRARPERRGILVGAAAALVAGLVHGLVDNAFFVPDLAVMTWFFIALLAAAGGDAPIERIEKASTPCAE